MSNITNAVCHLAQTFHHLPEHVLNSESWAWGDYAGVRYAFLHTGLELRELAGHLLSERAAAGNAPSAAQRLLARHHTAFRDFQSLLIGLPEAIVQQPPSPGEWPINVIVAHVHDVEQYFLVHILNALRTPTPRPVRGAEYAAFVTEILNEPVEPARNLPLAELWRHYERLHGRVLAELSGLSDAQLATISPMWEASELTIGFRMQRFEMHIREHANQLEKTIRALDYAPNESKLLLRQVYSALAEVEGALLGAGESGQAACDALAQQINERVTAVQAAVEQIHTMLKAVQGSDLPQVQALLAQNPRLATVRTTVNLSPILTATYNGQPAIASALAAAKGELDLFEAAATGNQEELKNNITYAAYAINWFNTDGFTALHLACFFGHAELVRMLLAAGADVHVVAKNDMRIQPLHAACANGNVEIARLLLEHGAAVNATQQNDFTPLMAARQNQNERLLQLLEEFGAVD